MNQKEYQIVVLAKQVPDTRNVGKDAMKEDGTVNRSALPAIFNPEDLKALEMALEIKDKLQNAKVTIITMGPPRAADIIRESIFRGADNGYIISDRKFAGSDTLATSYAISMAVRKVGHVDLIVSGRQAIDGDTAQVGPQVAEKLGIPQITYAEELVNVDDKSITIKRRIESGIEVVKSNFPVLVTVHGIAKDCRPRHAKRVIKYKKACTLTESKEKGIACEALWKMKPFLKIEEWSADSLNPDESRLGNSGSPTKVKSIENVVLVSKENEQIAADENSLNELMKKLIDSHIIG
jgi:Electron transfer flavoprotein, beta subunit